MTNPSKHHPSQLRTFAADLDAQRDKRDHKEDKPSTTKTPLPKPPKTETSVETEAKPIKPAPKLAPLPKPKPLKIPNQQVIKVAEEKTHTTSSSKKIPAFHELKKHVANAQKEIDKNASTKTTTPNAAKKQKPSSSSLPNVGSGATIITDLKHDRFKLFPSVTASLNAWFKKLTTKKKKAAPKYVIAETSRRKGVIQKATSQSGTIFTADNETLRAQIRKRHRETDTNDELETSWSPYTETGYALLEAPDGAEPVPIADSTQNVEVTFKKHQKLKPDVPQFIEPTKSEDLVPIEPSTEYEPAKETPVVTAEVPSDDNSISEAQWTASHDEVKETEYPDVPTEDVPTEEPINDNLTLEDSQEEAVLQNEQVEDQRTLLQKLRQSDTNTLALLLLVTIIIFTVLILGARVILGQFTDNNEIATQSFKSEPLLQDANMTSFVLDSKTLDKMPQLITEQIDSSPTGIVELSVMSPLGDEVAASYIFELLGFRTIPTLRQSITALRFVSVNRSQPVIVVQFIDEDTVRGGLLDWEETMVEDMSNLYNLTNTNTNTFVDETLGNTDVRILREDGETVIIYGIIGSNTLLISPNIETFEQVVDAKFSK